jgi:nickel transport protein
MGAWLEGDTLVAEVGFGDGSAADGAVFKVTDLETSEFILRGEADPGGLFEVVWPPEVFARGKDLLVTVDAGAGHRAEAKISAADFPRGSAEQESLQGSGQESGQESALAVKQASSAEPGINVEQLRALVREETSAIVQKELRPLRREIAALGDAGPGVTEIMGGIGYLLGLAGLAALIKRPKKDRGR